jgi:hypothetical protein
MWRVRAPGKPNPKSIEGRGFAQKLGSSGKSKFLPTVTSSFGFGRSRRFVDHYLNFEANSVDGCSK